MAYRILATGGAGYIGSHVVVALLEAGCEVVVLDNFENSDPSVIDRIRQITHQQVTLIRGDVRDGPTLDAVFRMHRIDAVIHLAGKKAVGDSVTNPLLYYHDNIIGAVSLLEAMQRAGVGRMVFSSSATVYGMPDQLPIDETFSTCVMNPYGRTKLMIEEILDDCVAANPEMHVISLRYFNPVGAHGSHLIGENPKGVPNNLFPIVAQTALGERPYVQVFGGDFNTPDGTGLRDYIHVVDLAAGHLAAIRFVIDRASSGMRHRRINLGTGTGHTVLEVIRAFSRACGFSVPYRIVARRPGDAGASVADASLAGRLLNWRARYGLYRMCVDQWAFASNAADDKFPAVAVHLKRAGLDSLLFQPNTPPQ